MKAGKGAGESGAGGAEPAGHGARRAARRRRARRPEAAGSGGAGTPCGRPPDPAETMEEEEGCKLWPIRSISARGAAFLPSLRRWPTGT